MSSWLRCDCGGLIHTNLFAGTGVLKLILDEDFDRLAEPFDTEAVRQLFFGGVTAYRCSQCGRLYVQWGTDGKLTTYLPQPPDANDTPSA